MSEAEKVGRCIMCGNLRIVLGYRNGDGASECDAGSSSGSVFE
jgi:hypothetical protein